MLSFLASCYNGDDIPEKVTTDAMYKALNAMNQLSMVLCTELAEFLKYGRGIRPEDYIDEINVDLPAGHVFRHSGPISVLNVAKC